MAKVAYITEFGGPDVLKVVDRDVGDPGRGEVKLAVKAAGLNRADVLLRQDMYIETPKLPSRLGYDAAGEVLAVGDGVKNIGVGDRVLTIPTFSQSEYGVDAEEAIVPAHALWPWPERLSAEEAACVGVQYTTVFFALRNVGQVERGDVVLLTAATGGVGLAAIEVAHRMGAVVIATSRNKEGFSAMEEAGADHVIATDTDDLAERVQDVTDGKGAKMIFDPIAGRWVPTMVACLANLGRYVIYGALDRTDPTLPLGTMIQKSASLYTYAVSSFTGNPAIGHERQAPAIEDARAFLMPRLADGRLKPIVSEVFSLDQIVDAHKSMESRRRTGKIILRVGS